MLLAMRLGLAWIGYERVRKVLVRLNRSYPVPAGECDAKADRLIWALRIAGKAALTERGCLPLALAAQFWLNRCGVANDLLIGVRRDATGKIEAHAWIEQHGRVLIGGSPTMQSYQTLPLVPKAQLFTR